MTNKRNNSCGTRKLGEWRLSGVVFPLDEQFMCQCSERLLQELGAEVLHGPRCAGEMTIARLHNIDIILVICPSCPNEDYNFDGCEINFKHDLHNASLLNFSNIVEMTSSH